MYNTRIAIQGLMGFKDIDLDLSNIKGNVVAIVGENGAGKSTLLESMGFAGLYRTFPSREQGIHKYCNSNDSFIENSFVFDGKDYTTKILINASGTRVEAYLFENGAAVNDGKAGSFDAEVVKRFGSAELVLSSVFSAQNSAGSFLSLPRPKRKELFISMLNLGILQDISAYSSDMEGQLAAKEKELLIKIQSIESACVAKIPDKDSLLAKKASLDQCVLEREGERDRLKALLLDLQRSEEEKQEVQRRIKGVKEQVFSLKDDENSLKNRIQSIQTEIKSNVSTSVAHIMGLELEADTLPSLEKAKEEKTEELYLIEARESANRNIAIEANKAVVALQNKLDNEESRYERCVKDSSRLKSVPCGGEGVFATCPMIQNSVEQKSLIPAVENEIRLLRLKLNDAKIYAKNLELEPVNTSGLKNEIRAIVEKIKSARSAGITLSALQEKKHKEELLRQKLDSLESNLKSVTAQLTDKQTELDSIKDLELPNSYDRINEIKLSIFSIESDIQTMRTDMHDVLMELGKIEVIKKNVQSALEINNKLSRELYTVRADKDEWSHLSYSFGPKAIQALEIDSAGPWVSDIINDLLRSCFGTRFSINLITQAMKANKSGMKDFFDIEVIDADKNRTGLINDLSGGEKVICSEAISLAIALYNSNIGGVRWDTLYRDECSGALSPKNALLYIKMLRRAIELGKFKRCFFIAHQPELVDASDNQIIIQNGYISVH